MRAGEEGRTVGAVVENALRLYLGEAGTLVAQTRTLPEVPELARARTMAELERTPTLQSLRGLVASVPAGGSVPPTATEVAIEAGMAFGQTRPMSARERQAAVVVRQERLRTHPEEESQ